MAGVKVLFNKSSGCRAEIQAPTSSEFMKHGRSLTLSEQSPKPLHVKHIKCFQLISSDINQRSTKITLGEAGKEGWEWRYFLVDFLSFTLRKVTEHIWEEKSCVKN